MRVIDYTALEFPEPPPDRPYTAINMVMSADGHTAVEGSERGLGSPTDQRLMRELRVHFDVVLNGAATFRASGTSARLNRPELEQWRVERGMTPSPIAAVLTRSGDLPAERRFFTDSNFDAVIYLSSAAPPDARQRLETLGRPVVEVPAGQEVEAAFQHMRDALGARRVLVEGGATLNGAIIQVNLCDELFLTLAPKIVGGPEGLPAVRWPSAVARAALQHLDLFQARTDPQTKELFLRYRFSA